MTRVVLIPGRFHTAASWDLVRPLLESAGHEVVPLDAADDSTTDLVLVAHGENAALLPRLAEHRRVAALVSVCPILNAPRPEWSEALPQWQDPRNWNALADRFFFHDVPHDLRAWAHSTVRPPVTLDDSSSYSSAVPSTRHLTVFAARDRVARPPQMNGVMTRIDAGHCPQISAPRDVAAAILFACDPARWEGTREWGEPEPADITTYESFMAESVAARHHIARMLTPDAKAELMRTHIGRWLAANRHRLTSEQIEAMESNLAFIRPQLYEPGESAKLPMVRNFELFSRDDLEQALTLYGKSN